MEKRIKKLTKLDPYKYAYTGHFLFIGNAKPGLWILVSLGILSFVFVRFFPATTLQNADQSTLSHLFTGVLYASIFILTLYAIKLIVRILSKIEIENAIALSIHESTSKELGAIRGKIKKRIDLNQIEEAFFPENPNHELSILRLGRLIIDEAKDRKFDSAVVLMEPYKEESVSHLYKINVIQKAALHLGILGTFIGLITAFAGLSVSSNTDSLLSQIIPSLEYSFTTSIAGLQASIIISFFMILVRRKQDAFFKHMEDATNSILSLSRNAINRDDFLTEFNQINDSVRQLDERVYDQTQEVHNQTSAIKSGLIRLSEVNGRFDGFLKDLSEREKVFLNEVRQFHNILSPKTISEQLHSSMQKSVEGIASALHYNLEEKIKKYNDLDKSILKINNNLGAVAVSLAKQEEVIKTSVNNLDRINCNFKDSLQKVSESQNDFIGKITGSHYSEKIREDFMTASNSLGSVLRTDLTSLNSNVSLYIKALNSFNNNASKYFGTRLLWEKRLLRVSIAFIFIVGCILVYKLYS